MRRRIQGFTLLETLIVLVIMGILFAIIFMTIGGQLQRSSVQAAVTQVGTDLERARSMAWKSGQATKVAVVSKTWYSYTVGTVVRPVALPAGTQFIYTGTPPSVSYSPPFADTSATSQTLTLASTSGSYPDTIRIIGVTGKVLR